MWLNSIQVGILQPLKLQKGQIEETKSTTWHVNRYLETIIGLYIIQFEWLKRNEPLVKA
jgi:hypothetical protein